jgi:hypothetical protein
MNIKSIMKEKGFEAVSSGGGCQWYTKEFTYKGKTAFLAITDNGALICRFPLMNQYMQEFMIWKLGKS